MKPENALNKIAVDGSEILKDEYYQLILIQYARKSIDTQIIAKKQLLAEKFAGNSPNLRSQRIEDIITLEKVSHGLTVWSDELNKHCPNPEDKP